MERAKRASTKCRAIISGPPSSGRTSGGDERTLTGQLRKKGSEIPLYLLGELPTVGREDFEVTPEVDPGVMGYSG
jgi:hypothetical protein